MSVLWFGFERAQAARLKHLADTGMFRKGDSLIVSQIDLLKRHFITPEAVRIDKQTGSSQESVGS